MIKDILASRLRDFAPADALEQENLLAEFLQHYVLASLSRSRFFGEAGFHGGTCLRILYGLNRFSEDLDFLLKEPHPKFEWAPHLKRIQKDCKAEGILFEAQDKSKASQAVKKAFLKTDSIGQIFTLELPHFRHGARKIRIKLEIDTNPPAGSDYETRYITFPLTAPVTTQTLESGFALKSHALLCREYTKGRDWYDFLWYVSRRTVPAYPLLGSALDQQGPWAGEGIEVTPGWYVEILRERIAEVDWEVARKDVIRFAAARERDSIALWSRELLLDQLRRFTEYAISGR